MKHVSFSLVGLVLIGLVFAVSVIVGVAWAQVDLDATGRAVNTLGQAEASGSSVRHVIGPALTLSMLSLVGIVMTGFWGVLRETRIESREAKSGETPAS